MENLFMILGYSPAFNSGKFEKGLKELFNIETIKHMETVNGKQVLDLDGILYTLTNKFNSDIANFFLVYFLLNMLQKKQMDLFFNNNYQGGCDELGYDNINEVIRLFNDLFVDKQILISNEKTRVAVDNFTYMLKDLPFGKSIVEESIKCPICNGSGIWDDEHRCLTCKGSGEVLNWAEKGNDITPNDLSKLELVYESFEGMVAVVFDEYVRFYLAMEMYDNGIDYYYTDSKFSYRASTFAVPIKLTSLDGGTFVDEKINVMYKHNGIEYPLPVLVNDPDLIEKPVEKPVETSAGEKRFTTAKPEVSEWFYTKKNGKKIVAETNIVGTYFDCTNSANYISLLFDAEKYTRDEVRQAYSSLAKVHKSKVHVIKK